ncbi:MAG TPA: dethiobiotin synthase, partial [Verrucomicrobiae bacterium]
DAEQIYAALEGKVPLATINPWHFRAPLAPVLAARREGKAVPLSKILKHIRAVQAAYDLTLVEGAGGLLSPLGEGYDSRDLILKLAARPVIVAQNRLGLVNHLRLTLAALPPPVRRRSHVVLMSPETPDLAAASNRELLADYVPSERLHDLPWLGRPVLPAVALRRRSVRRVLERLL